MYIIEIHNLYIVIKKYNYRIYKSLNLKIFQLQSKNVFKK